MQLQKLHFSYACYKNENDMTYFFVILNVRNPFQTFVIDFYNQSKTVEYE